MTAVYEAAKAALDKTKRAKAAQLQRATFRTSRPWQVGSGDRMKADRIIKLVKAKTARWANQRKKEERRASAIQHRRQAMVRTRKVTIKDAAFHVMEQVLSEGERGRHATCPCATDHVRGAAHHPRDDRQDS